MAGTSAVTYSGVAVELPAPSVGAVGYEAEDHTYVVSAGGRE